MRRNRRKILPQLIYSAGIPGLSCTPSPSTTTWPHEIACAAYLPRFACLVARGLMHRLICPTHFFSASFSLRKTSLLYLMIFVTPECLLVLFSENNWMHFSHLNINEYFPSKLPPNTLHPAYQVLHQSSRIPIPYLLFPPIISISSVPSLKCSFRGAVFVSPPPGHFYCSLQWP